MRKTVKLLTAVVLLSLSASMVSYAGSWKQDEEKKNMYGPENQAEVSSWWYQEDDGSYPAQCWKQIGQKWYYFNQDGWMLQDTITPDGKKVDESGAWVPGFIQSYPVEIGYNTQPPRFSHGKENGVTFTSPEIIGDILTGLDQITLEPLDENYDVSSVGMVTVLTLKFTDGTSQEIHYSGSYLVTGDKKYKMADKNEASVNAVLYQSYAKKLKAEGYESTPLGTVDNIKKEDSGWELSFRLNCRYELGDGDTTGITYQVKRGEAPVLDAAGDHWMVLHSGDQVQVIYDSSENGELTAKAILITEHAKNY
ncbi:hypothetical protein GPL15_20080 [Clostridium sp. MCC353]|uniref:hypothetical protein n=1 Tax=Clostridium sp. MCC353 TaxID=2592646 RepID=UPI001C03684A|nr:hypothetical protein [Clostridium sp. MCC353]MBT9778782.1 hypothetical protein [Clostridium sp. MCC353]